MNADQGNTKQTAKKTEELKTDGPLSEKDEVKAAEQKTAGLHKKAAANAKKK